MKKSKGSERNRHRMPGEQDKWAQDEFLMIIWEVFVVWQPECRSMPMVFETAVEGLRKSEVVRGWRLRGCS